MDIDLFTAFGVAAPTSDSFIKPDKRKREKVVIVETNDGKTIVEIEPENTRKAKKLTLENAVESNEVTGSQRFPNVIDLENEVFSGGSHLSHKTVQYSSVPDDYDAKENDDDVIENGIPRNPAKTYPFVLDTFQQEAINWIERGHSVLVAAHTSAGKTAVAEYAIAKALKNGQRVIYTSPIKALSNQKFRDMQLEFGNDRVGLMTGDITLNPAAQVLIMTTEILRSMLYRGSEVIREVAWVIFDEIHYMRDVERGIVWEEAIILLPHAVKFVFLSATIPNSKEFSDWIVKIHHQPCHVVYTNYRPVPLKHYLFAAGGDGIYLVVDGDCRFKEAAFQKAMACLKPQNELEKSSRSRRGEKNSLAQDLAKIVDLIMKKMLHPCIVFSFSKRDCEQFALQISQSDFNSEDESSLVSLVYHKAIAALSDDDKQLPQVQSLLPLLKRGIGIHHGGLLPLLKEIVEILFQEGLVKCLFATETFSIGINMPAKTVVFTRSRKYDGKQFRWITSGEYIQMSGRAGRRGKDDFGVVIQMIDEKMDPASAKRIMYGQADPLNSAYHVSFNMLLNMMRVDGGDPEFLVKSSFKQFQQERIAPEHEARARLIDNAVAEMVVPNEHMVVEYYGMAQQLEAAEEWLRVMILDPVNSMAFLCGGRLVKLMNDLGYGVCIAARKRSIGMMVKNDVDDDDDVRSRLTKLDEYVVDVLIPCRPLVDYEGRSGLSGVGAVLERNRASLSSSSSSSKNDDDDDDSDNDKEKGRSSSSSQSQSRIFKDANDEQVRICQSSEPGAELRLVPFPLSLISQISKVKLKNLPDDLHSKAAKKSLLRHLNEAFGRLSKIEPMDPIGDMRIRDDKFDEVSARRVELSKVICDLPFHALDGKQETLDLYKKKMMLMAESRKFHKLAIDCQAISLRDDMRKMKRVLRRLSHLNGLHTVDTKGQIACEINTADELVITELVFTGVFNSLSPQQCVSLLSCFVYDDARGDDANPPTVPPSMQVAYRQLLDTARAVAQVSVEAQVEESVDDCMGKINAELMGATLAWANSSRFLDVCKLTGAYEGSLVRAIRRLDELLRQLVCASKAIGSSELQVKFEEASRRIRRDIVFAASLYL